MDRPVSRCVWLSTMLLAAALLAACGSAAPDPVQGAPVQQEVRQSRIDCHLAQNKDSGLCRQEAALYFKDEQDGGDDPIGPGCHVSFSDAVCTADRANWSGDICLDSNTLREWTDTSCHTLADAKEYDCDKHCRGLGHAAGECRETSTEFCAPHGSAYCKCTGVT